MNFIRRGVTLALLVSCFSATSAFAAETNTSLIDALRQGTPVLDLRYRFESVSDDALAKDADASTLRTVVGYSSAVWKGLSLAVEAENVSVLGEDLYNNAGAGASGNSVTDRPVVADPAGTALLRAKVAWQGPAFAVQAGRDEITLGDHRFVGNVGWRQHHQSFDAITIRSTSLHRVQLFYGYLAAVHKINRSTDDLNGHLGNVGVDLGGAGHLTMYGYLLDYDQPSRWRFSSSTYGAEWAGSHPLAGKKLSYELELAHQSDAGDNPGRIDADYGFVKLGYSTERFGIQASYEVLDGSPERGQFNTPLATLHKFNGWADKFLVTPPQGLTDLEIRASGKLAGIGWILSHHQFDSATGSVSYGSEIDLQLLYKASWGQAFGLTGALYDADELGTDTDKWMLWTSFSI